VVFVDRHEGYALPTWVPIEMAFSRVKEPVDVRIGAVHVNTAGRDKRLNAARGVPEGTAGGLDDVLNFFSATPLVLGIVGWIRLTGVT
jgi:hypothetical protein